MSSVRPDVTFALAISLGAAFFGVLSLGLVSPSFARGKANVLPQPKVSPQVESPQVEPPLRVEPLGPDSISLKSGEEKTFRFQLRNASSSRKTIRLSLRAPDEWEVLSFDSKVSLSPGESSLVLPLTSVPGDMKAGTYEVALSAKVQSGEDQQNTKGENSSSGPENGRLSPVATASVKVQIPTIRKASFQVVEEPSFSVGPYRIAARLRNRGNEPITYAVSADASPEVPIQVLEKPDTLFPKRSALIPVRVQRQSDGDNSVFSSDFLGRLFSQSGRQLDQPGALEPKQSALSQSVRLSVEISPWDTTLTAGSSVDVPRPESGVATAEGRYPMNLQLTSRSLGRGSVRPGISLRGRNPIGESRSDTLSLSLRTGGAFFRSTPVQFRYRTENWSVALDNRLSLPTGGNRFRAIGETARFQYIGDRYKFGTSLMRGRYSTRDLGRPLVGALFGGRSFGSGRRLDASVFGVSNSARNGVVGSVGGSLPFEEDGRIELNGTYGRSDEGSSLGYRASVKGSVLSIRYRLEDFLRPEVYPQPRAGTRRSQVQLSSPLTDFLNMSVSGYRSRRSLTEDQTLRTLSARGGLSFNGSYRKARLRGSVRGRFRSNQSRSRRSGVLQAALNLPNFRFRSRNTVSQLRFSGRRTGRLERYAFKGEANVSSFGFGSSFRLQRQFQVRSTLGPFGGATPPSQGRSSQGSASGQDTSSRSGDALVSNRLLIRPFLGYSFSSQGQVRLRGTLREQLPVEVPLTRGLGSSSVLESLSLRLNYRFSNGHSLRLSSRTGTFGDDTGLAENIFLRFRYRLPLSVPSPFSSSDRKTLNGRVIDYETGEPIKGIRINLGRARRLSGRDGKFSIPIPSRPKPLQIREKASGRVVMNDLSRPIGSSSLGPASPGGPDEDPSIQIVVADASRITVKAFEKGYKTEKARLQGKAPVREGSLQGSIITFEKRGGPRFLRRTNSGGTVTSSSLSPGEWTVGLPPEQVPDGKSAEPGSISISLDPGQDTTLIFNAVPSEEDGGGIEFRDGGDFPVEDSDEPSENSSSEDSSSVDSPTGSSPTGSLPTDDSTSGSSSAKSASVKNASTNLSGGKTNRKSDKKNRSSFWAVNVASLRSFRRARQVLRRYRDRLAGMPVSVRIVGYTPDQNLPDKGIRSGELYFRISFGSYKTLESALRAKERHSNTLPPLAWPAKLFN